MKRSSTLYNVFQKMIFFYFDKLSCKKVRISYQAFVQDTIDYVISYIILLKIHLYCWYKRFWHLYIKSFFHQMLEERIVWPLSPWSMLYKCNNPSIYVCHCFGQSGVLMIDISRNFLLTSSARSVCFDRPTVTSEYGTFRNLCPFFKWHVSFITYMIKNSFGKRSRFWVQ